MDARSTHCPYCGTKFGEPKWPRTCGECRRTSWVNPIPVAVVLLPIDDGVLVIRRGIEPGFGKLALPGGFMDLGESWQQAAARELFEETGIRIDPLRVRHLHTASPEDGRLLLVFGEAARFSASELPPFVPTAETTERTVIRQPIELAFPLHTEVLRAYFAR